MESSINAYKLYYMKICPGLSSIWDKALHTKDEFLAKLAESQAKKVSEKTIVSEKGNLKIPTIIPKLVEHFYEIKIIPPFLLSHLHLPDVDLSRVKKLPPETQDLLFSYGACAKQSEGYIKFQKCINNKCAEIFEGNEPKTQQCQEIYNELQASLKKAGCKCKHRGIKNKYFNKFKKLIEEQ